MNVHEQILSPAQIFWRFKTGCETMDKHLISSEDMHHTSPRTTSSESLWQVEPTNPTWVSTPLGKHAATITNHIAHIALAMLQQLLPQQKL